MRKSQSNYLRMTRGTTNLMANNAEVWRDEPLVVESVKTVDSLCVKIDKEAILQQQNVTVGHTAVKDQRSETLKNRLFNVSERMGVYAEKSNDPQTASVVAFSRSQLNEMSLSKLVTTAGTVVETANRLNTALEPFKITEEDIISLQDAIDDTVQMTAVRDAAKGNRSKNTSQLIVLFNQLRKELKLLDKLVKAYIKDEEFLVSYFCTRRINDVRGGRPKKKNDNATDGINN